MNAVLSRGTWYFDRKPMVLCAWGTNFGAGGIKSVPVWVKFSNIPDYYWTRKGLSHLASAIGDHICADKLTSQLNPLPFAKKCVTYKIREPLPDTLRVATINPLSEDTSFQEVKVDYISKPVVCTGCNSLGHYVGDCPFVKRIWVQKQKTEELGAAQEAESNTKENASVAQGEECTMAHYMKSKGKMEGTTQPEVHKGAEWYTLGKNGKITTLGKSKLTETSNHVETLTCEKFVPDSPQSMESPSPPITFKNLRKIDEVEGKRHNTTTLSKSQLKRLKKNKG